MEYFLHLAILFSIFAILAISLQLIVGYTGLLSVAHAGFYGIGAYIVALLLKNAGMNFFPALLLGALGSMLVAFLIGIVLSRFRDDYYALGSLGFGVIAFSILLNWQELTRGPLGIPGIPRPELFGFEFSSNLSYLLLSFILLGAVYAFSRFLTLSSFGRALQAIREDEEALSVFGYRTSWFKLAVFVIGAGMAGIAGGLFASYITYIDPGSFNVTESIFILSLIILGGLGSLRGAVVGALVLILLPEALRFVGFTPDIAAQMRQVVYGVLLIVLMLYRPQGLMGKYKL
ncbi:branched-chain amino acid ABC transporter permease [Patescibacteria group bacterium]|nr:branched-chain amino acid ABC transporter permease [Patescibacteria group bacterium]